MEFQKKTCVCINGNNVRIKELHEGTAQYGTLISIDLYVKLIMF